MARNVKDAKKTLNKKKPKVDFELSSGALVFRRTPEGILWLVLQYSAGHWDFPKGHVEQDESLIEAAKREIFEETGIKNLKFYPKFKKSIQYFYNPFKYSSRAKSRGQPFGIASAKSEACSVGQQNKEKKLVFKKVIFHLAETSEKEIKTSFEHLEGKWLKTEEAKKS